MQSALICTRPQPRRDFFRACPKKFRRVSIPTHGLIRVDPPHGELHATYFFRPPLILLLLSLLRALPRQLFQDRLIPPVVSFPQGCATPFARRLNPQFRSGLFRPLIASTRVIAGVRILIPPCRYRSGVPVTCRTKTPPLSFHQPAIARPPDQTCSAVETGYRKGHQLRFV